MKNGGLAKIRVDMISSRPHSMFNYQLQGTSGCYESARAPGERHRIWLRSKCEDPNSWLDLEDLEEEFLPRMWKEASDAAQKAEHGGGDYFEILDFVNAVQGKQPPAIGIHEVMDMTIPGLISQQSIAEDGRWIEVPDSCLWQQQGPRVCS